METSKYFPSVETLDEGYQKTFKNCDELLPTLPQTKGWWFGQLFQYHGFWISGFCIRGSMLNHDHFKPRSTDIVVATSPKCGTTWLRALVFSIINRASFDFSDHPLRKANPQDLVIVEQIVKLCSFESMSNQDVNKLDKRYQQRPVSNSDFFRKGEVGDWVNHLSPQMAEKLDQITEEKLQDTGFNFH
ncbi:hypothetical protein GOBAR_DD26737 [Gossypium barbadense]|nr:hypothetical protein GOBAR_DD26737 [Gossypium barbadense]